MSSDHPSITLNNGVQMPALGLGVFLAPAEQTSSNIRHAVKCGYRLFDTAAAYLNERAVGEGIRSSGIAREELFVTTKLWVTKFGYDSTLKAFDESANRLGLDYVDLYLLHWPLAGEFDKTIDSWLAAEQLLSEGRVRAIGVSNFLPVHLENLASRSEVVPAVNQIELHPYFQQKSSRALHRKMRIVTQSWAPIGGIYGRKPEAVPEANAHPLQHPVIVGLAEKYDKSPAQVIIRWHLDHRFSVIPKSVKPERISANIDVFDFELTPDEVASIDALDTNERAGPDPATFDAGTYVVDVDAQ